MSGIVAGLVDIIEQVISYVSALLDWSEYDYKDKNFSDA